MKIESLSKKGNFRVWNEDREILKMNYSSWFSNKAATEYNHQKIEIKPKHYFSSDFLILRNEKQVGKIKFNWNGHIHLNFKDVNSQKQRFILRSKSLWKRKYELIDHNKNIIFDLLGENNWSSMSYDYDIEPFQNNLNTDENELLAYVGYAANLHRSMTNSAG